MILARVVPGQVWSQVSNGRQVQVVAATGRWATIKVLKVGVGSTMAPRKGTRAVDRDVIHKNFTLLYDPDGVE
jgi:hypothetical protein